ncbi:hypothetical protein KN1_20160 [Stygiolobus caldivivus]|uniref:Uncharacterized protein n=2 Tax=Stygiolobus caldivivus TaxID=2824673 RepID=A0A8D5U8J9_9CREN|nr:hypothetical protein KN1_20160 [Stygiolobus caldivivus]
MSGRELRRGKQDFGLDEPKPMPLGEKCNYLCPFFRCNKKALNIQKKYIKGTPQKVGYCMWVGDVCITGECQYAYCEKRALLPGNKCAFAVNKKNGGTEDMEKELKHDEYDNKVKELLSKKYGRRDLDFV